METFFFDRPFRFWIVYNGQLNLLTQWGLLRGEPRFEKIVASFAP
jgi:hypothetical protein